MSSDGAVSELPELQVNVAETAVARARGVLATHGLGSCVAIAIYDPVSRVGALGHVLLPDEDRPGPVIRPARSATHAVPHLVALARKAGAVEPLVAKIAGGASMFGALLASGGINVGERNVEATRRALQRAGVTLLAEDVGGDHGRSVSFNVADGSMRVRSLKRGDRLL